MILEGGRFMTGKSFTAYRSKITHGTKKPSKLPCGCVVESDEVHSVANDLLNIQLIQCIHCHKVIALNPIDFYERKT